MAQKVHHLQTDFTGGELNPMLYGRVNADRYGSGVKVMRNAWTRVSGGAESRAGLRYVNKAKNDTGIIRLVPWVYNRDQSYVLEITDGKMRFIQQGQLVTASDSSPDIYEIDTGISGDKLATLSFAQSADTMIFAHPEMKPKKLVRNGQRDWVMSDVVFDVMPFDELAPQPPTGWATLDKNDYVGQTVVVSLADGSTGGGYTGTGFTAADVGKYVRVYDGLIKITAFTDKAHVTGDLRTLMTVNPVRGTGSASDPKVWPPAPVDNWRILETMWSDAYGWPSCVVFHQQRLLFAGSSKFPQYIWGSKIRQFWNFELGAGDSAAWSFQLDSNQINPILHLFSMNGLVALTAMNEFLITSPTGVITPTAVNVRSPSQYGSNPVLPLRVATDLLYLQRGSHKLLSLNYDPDNQTGYQVSEISLLAEHMLESPVIDMTAASQPFNRIHMLKLDGTIATLTVNKQVGVAAWCQTVTGSIDAPDAFLSCATIPREDGTDDTYVAVARNIGGTPRVYLEHFQPGLYVDAGIVGQIANDTDPAQSTWGKLEHLEGMVVNVVGDGVVLSPQTVRNGQITTELPVRHVAIGLPYVPHIQLLKPEATMQNGSLQGAKLSISRVRLRLFETTGVSINGSQLPFRYFGGAPGQGILDKAPPLFSGDIDYQERGWNNSELVIEQRQPLPFHLLAVVRDITITD